VAPARRAEEHAKTALLRSLPPFTAWPAPKLAHLARAMEMHIVTRHAPLVAVGDAGGGHMYFVKEGEVRVEMRQVRDGGGGGGGAGAAGAGGAGGAEGEGPGAGGTRVPRQRRGSGDKAGPEQHHALPPIHRAGGSAAAAAGGSAAAAAGGRGSAGGGRVRGVEVAVLAPGEMFGELAALTGCPQPYDVVGATATAKVGRCRLPVSKPEFKACLVSALKIKGDEPLSNFALNISLCHYTKVYALSVDAMAGGVADADQADVAGQCRLTLSNRR